MQKLKSVIVFISFFISIKCLFAFPLLPEPFKQPHIPKPGTEKCISCGYGEKPKLDRFCYPVTKVNLFEERNIPENELLTINIGEPGPFSPETKYILHPPGTPGAIKDYLMAEIGRWKVLFRAQMDKIGAVAFFASNLPGYAIRREGDNLVLANYNTLQEFSFASLDAGQTWKLISLRRLNQPNSTIKCEYDNEGYMTRLTLPGGRIYKIEYKYGQVQKVISPNGTVTNFYWNEIGFLARVKTVLTENHPFYRKPKKKRWSFRQKKVELPVVRDIYIESSMDGHLSSLTTSSGERYNAEYMLDRNKYRQITTGILTHPNGRRDYRINKTAKGMRASDVGVVENKNDKDAFLPYKKLRYASSNGSLYIVSTNGIKKKRAPGTLAIIEQTDAMGNTTKYKYNKLWQRTKTINPDGGVDQKVYDDYGRKIKEVDECNRTKTFKRNKNGLLLEYKYGNVKTQYEYNGEEYPIKTITPDGLCHKFSWDKFGRMTSHTKPDGTVVKYDYYGTLDYLAKLTTTSADQKENDYQKYSYDAKGRLTRIDYPDNTYEEFKYDCCNMIEKRYRSGKVIHYAYDPNHKLTKISTDNKVLYQAEYDIYGRLEKEIKSGQKNAVEEERTLLKAQDFLQKGHILYEEQWEEGEKKILGNYQLLTLKPRIYLLNGQESEIPAHILEAFNKNKWPYLIMNVALELGASDLSAQDRISLGLPERSELDILIQATYKLLGLITFFTTGPDETRAWVLKKGLKAPDAGGVIHSDFREKFIKAEVINWEKLLEAGSWSLARQKGWLQLEGKEYEVQDGDVIIFKHG